jgi:hypothetical protein
LGGSFLKNLKKEFVKKKEGVSKINLKIMCFFNGFFIMGVKKKEKGAK